MTEHPASNKIIRRSAFLEDCAEETKLIHIPLIDLAAVNGHLNPAGLGDAELFSETKNPGQSSVGFETLDSYIEADRTGVTPYKGSAEYGIVRTPEADAVCRKMAELHGGYGAIICASGLAAITTTLSAFAPAVLALPENVYFPTSRYINWLNAKEATPRIKVFHYSSSADASEIEALLQKAKSEYSPIQMIYLEAPSSKSFEIPDIDGIAALARVNGIRTVMDNSWATHVRFKPLAHNIDIVIQATTKYEGGYGDTPSGVVIAGNEADFRILAHVSRVFGAGGVAPPLCSRLFHRVDSTAERMNRQFATAQQLMNWFRKQDFIAEILCPALEVSPGYERFKKYFGKGNGLFTILFREGISAAQITGFIDALVLFRIAQSWGGHVSLILPTEMKPESKGRSFRLHAGLESSADLIRDLDQASKPLFG